MDEHERLRRLAATLIMELSEAGYAVEADDVQDGVFPWLRGDDPATIERLTIAETQWQDVPPGEGHRECLACFTVEGRIVYSLVSVSAQLIVTAVSRKKLWLKRDTGSLRFTRLPDPPPVAADDASSAPNPSPDACNLPLRWPHIGPDETCEQCGQQARVHRHWHGEEVQRG